MPYYDYRCRACGQVFEIQRSMNANAEGAAVACTDCGSTDTERVFTPIAVATDASSKEPVPATGASCGPGCACHPN